MTMKHTSEKIIVQLLRYQVISSKKILIQGIDYHTYQLKLNAEQVDMNKVRFV